MKSRLILTLAIILFALSLVFPANAAKIIKEGECGENAVWVLDDTGTLTVKGTGMVTGGLQFAGYYAGEDAFGNNGITTLVFEEGITSIHDEIYIYGRNITSVRFPNSLVSIGNNVFSGFEKLKDVYIPAGVQSIGYGNFDGCNIVIDANNPYLSTDSYGVLFNKDKTVLYHALTNTDLTSYAVPYGVTTISDNAFGYCRRLSSIALPDTLGSIGSHAFEGTSIKTLHIPAGVWSIGESALGSPDKITVAPENGVYRVDEFGALLSATELLYFHDKNAVSYAIPYGITHIGNNVFAGCKALSAVGIPNTVVSIGDSAFKGCSSLTRMDFSATNLTTVGKFAFYDCSSLKKFIPSKTLKSIDYYAFGNCSKISTLNFSNCPLESIGDDAFRGCRSLYSIDLPEKMKHLGVGVFCECSELEELIIPDGVPIIYMGIVEYCTSLKKVVVPPSVIKIDGYHDDYSYTAGGFNFAFYPDHEGNSNYTIYGYSGTHIEEYVRYVNGNEGFSGRGLKLKSLGKYTPPKERTIVDSDTYGNIVWTIDDMATLTISGTGILDLGDVPPEDFNEPWWLSDPWAKYSGVIKKIVVEEGITEIHDNALAGGHFLREVVLPRSLTEYDGTIVSYGKEDKITVYGYEGSYAESYAKKNGYKFEPIRETVKVEINNGVIEEAGKPSEGDKEKEEKPTLIKYGDTEINGQKVISWTIYSDGCLNVIINHDIPSGTDWLPYSKEDIKKISVDSSKSVKGIKDEAFCEFPNVESIEIGSRVTKIGNRAFRNCTSLTRLILSRGSACEIGDEAFLGCESLASINLPDSVTTIGRNAFKGCKSLTRIVIPKYIKRIAYGDTSPFHDCKNLTVYGYTGTEAEKVSTMFGIPFVPIDEYFDPHAFAEDHPEITLTVDRAQIVRNGIATPLEVPAQILDGRTLVPLRAIFEALGASVDWEGTTQTVTSVKGKKTVILTVGVPSISVNGEAKPLDVPAQIVNGRTLVPARAVAEAFGCEVVWVPETRTVVII